MAVTKDEILDAISKMSVMEVVELISDMEKKFNVTAAAPVAAAAAPGVFFNGNRHLNQNQVQVGFDYKFDMYAPAPVVARY